jgi:hypothetical protein
MADEGYGAGGWGTSEWGIGASPLLEGSPDIIPLNPLDGDTNVPQAQPVSFRLADDAGVNLATLMVNVGGSSWVIGGVAMPGIEMTSVANNVGGFDVELRSDTPHIKRSQISVSIFIKDGDELESSISYSFSVGIGLRMVGVRNPLRAHLDVLFNGPLTQDAALFSIDNWKITPVSDGALPLIISEVIASQSSPCIVRLRHTGGGSTYNLRALGIIGADGSTIEDGYSNANFDIVFEEEATPKVRLFNSVFGPLGISQRALKRRTVDEFVANRSIALALDEQFRLRFQQLDNTVGRDGRPGKLRTT